MGIKIFRDEKWKFIEYMTTSLQDLKGLDPEKDRELIDFLVLHAPERARIRLAEKCGLEEVPEERVNIDDPGDEIYRTYFLFREQAEREDDREVLRNVAMSDSGAAGKFAFCRLTGYSWPPDQCDAYSYRTYECDLLSGMSREEIVEFCREMVERDGPFKRQAEERLASLSECLTDRLAIG